MTTTLPNTLDLDYERWSAGLNIAAFVDAIDSNQAETRRRLREVQLSAQDQAYFAQFVKPIYALALTEGWCGDSLMNLPILAKIAEAAPGLELRIFIRSQEPELTAAYQARNVKNIPVFSFFDAAFNELGTWVERSQAAHERVGEWRLANPELEAIRNDASLSDAEKQARLQPILTSLRAQMETWYAEALQNATIAEIKALLGRGY
jgi:hypothetical protein